MINIDKIKLHNYPKLQAESNVHTYSPMKPLSLFIFVDTSCLWLDMIKVVYICELIQVVK